MGQHRGLNLLNPLELLQDDPPAHADECGRGIEEVTCPHLRDPTACLEKRRTAFFKANGVPWSINHCESCRQGIQYERQVAKSRQPDAGERSTHCPDCGLKLSNRNRVGYCFEHARYHRKAYKPYHRTLNIL